jgi:hypothetical protein
MKQLIIWSATACLLFINTAALACEVCKKQQPKMLQGVTHGAGPQSDWDYVIVAISAFIVIVSFFLSVKLILRPGETNKTHIKRSVLNLDRQ